MAVEMFLKLAGCDGESIATGFTNQIELIGWNWGMLNEGSSSMGGGSGTGKASFQDLTVTKVVDKASATIMSNCAKGKHFDTATLSCRKVGGNAALVYLEVTMKQAFVSLVQHHNNSHDEQTTETVSFNFAQVDVTYKPQSAQGSAAGSVPFKWDIRKNEAA